MVVNAQNLYLKYKFFIENIITMLICFCNFATEIYTKVQKC